jgi:hypothetical protein
MYMAWSALQQSWDDILITARVQRDADAGPQVQLRHDRVTRDCNDLHDLLSDLERLLSRVSMSKRAEMHAEQLPRQFSLILEIGERPCL